MNRMALSEERAFFPCAPCSEQCECRARLTVLQHELLFAAQRAIAAASASASAAQDIYGVDKSPAFILGLRFPEN